MRNETVELQTNLMNIPAELLFKLDYSNSCSWMYGGKLEFSLRRRVSEDMNHTYHTAIATGHRGLVICTVL